MLPVLVGYTLIFVLPPFVLLGLYQVMGSWMEDRMGSWQEKLQRAHNEALLWILGIIGFFLLVDAAQYFNVLGISEGRPEGLRSPSQRMWKQFVESRGL